MSLLSTTNRRRSTKNIISDILYQILTMVFGAVLPRLFIVNLGSEVNGLVSSVGQVLTYVALLEAGVGAASLQALFRPVKDNDQSKINEVLAATNHFYLKTGALYSAVLIVLAFAFPITVDSDIPYWTITAVVLISGIPSVISYLFQGKYTILLNAEGKGYILKNILTIVFFFSSIVKIVMLSCGCNVIAVLSLGVVNSVAQVIYIEIYIHKHYKWINLHVDPDFLSIKQSKNALVHQVAWLVTTSTDIIVLTYVCGLKVVSVYTLYRSLLGILDGVINAIINGVHFAMGQSFQESLTGYEKKHNTFEAIIISLTFGMFCVARIFLSPFLKLYTSGIEDISYIDLYLPYLFVAVHILVESRATSWETISVAGLFEKTQHQPIIEAVINMVVSLALVFWCGVYGVLIGTIVASLYRLISMVEFSNKKILKRTTWYTYRRYIICAIIFVGITIGANVILNGIEIKSYFALFLYAFIACLIVFPAFFIGVFAFEKSAFKNIMKRFGSRKDIQS